MTTATLPTFNVDQNDFFQTLESGQVDLALKQIRGAAIIQLGNVADDRPFFADETTLQQVIAMAGESLRARVNHDGLVGGYIGRWKNFRLDGDTLRADLHIAEVAWKTRGPASNESNLAEYVLGIAEEDPGAIGVSIAPRLDKPAMLQARRTDGRYPIRISALRAADLVDTPAATHNGLFSAETTPERGTPVKVLLLDDGKFAVLNDDGTQTEVETTFASLDISVEMLQALPAVKDLLSAAVVETTTAIGEKTKVQFFAQIDDLAKTFGDAGFSAVLPIVKGEKDAATFRAEQAEAEAASLKAENEKLRKGAAAPGFSASDKPAAGGADNSEAARKAAFEKDNQGFSSFETFSAYEDAKAKGLCD